MRGDGHGFIDPTPGLMREYEEAVVKLRRDAGDLRTVRGRWRCWRARRRLYRELVDRPRRTASW
jgi:hypothetical protein